MRVYIITQRVPFSSKRALVQVWTLLKRIFTISKVWRQLLGPALSALALLTENLGEWQTNDRDQL